MRRVFKFTYKIYLDKAKPSINLSWGMDALDTIKANNIKLPVSSTPRSKPVIPGVYEKRSEQEELEKVMKKYDEKKKF